MELETFVKWLECLFAAIDVAIPIDERDFPRDQSIPRIQRLQWLRGQFGAQATGGGEIWDSFGSGPTSPFDTDDIPVDTAFDAEISPFSGVSPDASPVALSSSNFQPEGLDSTENRPSTSSATDEDVERGTGKWRPRHLWSTTHDMVYAKLCYAVLLFKSPRKSNFVIFKGKRWHIDWSTGQMSRVQPPSYGEPEFWGPWQVIHTDNRRL